MIDVDNPNVEILPGAVFPYWRNPNRYVIIFENPSKLTNEEILDVLEKSISLYNKCLNKNLDIYSFGGSIINCRYDSSEVMVQEGIRRAVELLDDLRTDIPENLLIRQTDLMTEYQYIREEFPLSYTDLPAEYVRRYNEIWTPYYKEYIKLELQIRDAFIRTYRPHVQDVIDEAQMRELNSDNLVRPHYFDCFEHVLGSVDRLHLSLLQQPYAKFGPGEKFIQVNGYVDTDVLLSIAGIFGCGEYETHVIYT